MFGGGSDTRPKLSYPKPRQHVVEVEGCRKTMFFFDNDAHNFSDRGRCMCVVPVEIDESRPIGSVGGLPVFVDQATYLKYVTHLEMGAKAYGQQVIKDKGIDSYDPKSGLKVVDINYYTKQIKNKVFRERVGAFIFDWDRTLTVFEGVPAGYGTVGNLLGQRQGIPQFVKPKDIATYYFGGTERVRALRTLFEGLNRMEIPVYILSANRGIEKYTQFFSDLLESIGIQVNPSHMIYRGRLTKYQYIEEVLPDLCQGNPRHVE